MNVESSPSNLPVVSYGKIQLTLFGENSINETFTLTKKDDEELGVGTTLSKIVVPHPALQEPTAVEMMYTAYSGWISSGLKKWSIDKIKISDSFGKSVSHCKKDLVLESNVAVMLKLYPGDCNPPREATTTEEVDPFFVTESTKATEEKNAVARGKEEMKWSGNKTVDGFPAYDINVHNLTDESSTVAIAPQVGENNYTLKIIRRNEITEPVLQPKVKEEVDEPVLKSIEKVQVLEKRKDERKSAVRPRGIDLSSYGNIDNRIDGNFTGKQWIPSVELFPPPLGGKQLWETMREPKSVNYPGVLKTIVPPFLQKNQKQDMPPYVTTLQNKLLHYDKMNKTKRGNETISLIQAPQGDLPKNGDGTVTVQLFPQHLAAILKQAEQYARMSLFSPLDMFTRNRYKSRNETKAEEKKDEPKQETIATPRSLDVKPRSFLPRIYEYIEKGFENVKSLLGFGQESRKTESYVPYYHSDKNHTKESKDAYIPLRGS